MILCFQLYVPWFSQLVQIFLFPPLCYLSAAPSPNWFLLLLSSFLLPICPCYFCCNFVCLGEKKYNSATTEVLLSFFPSLHLSVICLLYLHWENPSCSRDKFRDWKHHSENWQCESPGGQFWWPCDQIMNQLIFLSLFFPLPCFSCSL